MRNGNAVLARTDSGPAEPGDARRAPRHRADRRQRAGVAARGGDLLHGCGTVDMKSGDAVFLHLAATIENLAHDLTLVFYDCEEIAAVHNGLGRIERETPRLAARATSRSSASRPAASSRRAARARCGCALTTRGTRAHSARSWLGDNAIHRFAPVLQRLADYTARSVDIDGCVYREGLSAVRIARRRRGQRGARRGGDGRQLPLRPRPQRRAGHRARAGGLRRHRAGFRGHRPVAGRAARAAATRRPRP